MPQSLQWLIAYAIAVSLVAAVMTVWDKACARRGRWRVAESTLFLVAALGGAAAMYATMRLVRHKTRHRRFMWGLPLIMAAQAALLFTTRNWFF